jgi:hypothetical protein
LLLCNFDSLDEADHRCMASPQLTPEQIAQVSGLVAEYIASQREKALPSAVPLSPTQRASMDGLFQPQVLDTRLLVLGETRVESPPFYPLLRQMGFTNLPNFATMAAVTFCDVVVSHQPFADGLLFHELVHAEQYRQLGSITRFAELFVRGFLSGGGYDGIPLEVNAYELGGRFESSPRTRFSVADEVGAWIRAGRF